MLLRRRWAVAPMIRVLRKASSPARAMPPSPLPAGEWSFGVSPGHAANWRLDWNGRGAGVFVSSTRRRPARRLDLLKPRPARSQNARAPNQSRPAPQNRSLATAPLGRARDFATSPRREEMKAGQRRCDAPGAGAGEGHRGERFPVKIAQDSRLVGSAHASGRRANVAEIEGVVFFAD